MEHLLYRYIGITSWLSTYECSLRWSNHNQASYYIRDVQSSLFGRRCTCDQAQDRPRAILYSTWDAERLRRSNRYENFHSEDDRSHQQRRERILRLKRPNANMFSLSH
ncbi:hypothetical protein GN244_ATG20349 [Phytophthora infestans]|uniref:Uncharacterized protein n=1 Tax=Phytophthora infestans TaxID=4787 RepID=A0A833S634_PHYIN|nr:hypothetical protein GN244_ATG20349 [Phytophthora infestans]